MRLAVAFALSFAVITSVLAANSSKSADAVDPVLNYPLTSQYPNDDFLTAVVRAANNAPRNGCSIVTTAQEIIGNEEPGKHPILCTDENIHGYYEHKADGIYVYDSQGNEHVFVRKAGGL